MTAPTETTHPELEGLGTYEYGWADSDVAGASARRGLSEDVVRDISAKKSEPEWMLKRRLKGLKLFEKKPMPTWGSDLSEIDFDSGRFVNKGDVLGCGLMVMAQKTTNGAAAECEECEQRQCTLFFTRNGQLWGN